MGNWSNVQLVVIGSPARVATFARLAGPSKGRIRRPKPPVWEPWMEFGESDALTADGLETRGRRSRIRYRLQTKSPDLLDHFRGVSRQFPALHLILGWGDNPLEDISSDYLHAGRVRHYRVPLRTILEVQRKHIRAYVGDAPLDESTEEAEFWADVEAEWELSGMAVARWEREVGWPQRALRRRSPPTRS
jgi:hypothetical protein